MMDGEIITSGEMRKAGQLATALSVVSIQHGLGDELSEAIIFLNGLYWKGQER